MSGGYLPPAFVDVEWNGQTMFNPARGRFGIHLLDANGVKYHFALTPACARLIYETDIEMRAVLEHERCVAFMRANYVCVQCGVQSHKASERPNDAGLPQEGQ